MSKDNNIEKKYRDTFNGAIPAQNWNEPSDSLWGGIESAVNEPKKDWSIWPLLFSLLFAVSAGSIAYLYSSLRHSESLLLEKEMLLQRCGSDKKLSQSSDSGTQTGNPKAEAAVVSSNKTVSDKVTVTSAVVSVIAPATSTAEESVVQKPIHTVPVDQKTAELKNATVKSTFVMVEMSEVVDREEIVVEELVTQSMKVVGSQDQVIPSPKTATLVQPTREANPWYFTATVINEIGNIRKEGTQTTPLTELIDSEYGSHSVGLSFGVDRTVSSQWTVSAGLAYTRQQYRTNYDLQLGYDLASEELLGVDGQVSFQHSLPSFLGNLDTELILGRSLSSSVSDSEEVTLDFDTRTTLQSIGVPLTMTYNPRGYGKGLSLGMQLRPSYIAAASSSIHGVVSHHDAIHNRYSDSRLSEQSYTNLQLHAGLTLGYSWQLGAGSTVQVGLSYLRGVTSLYNTEEFSSSNDIYSSGVTLSRRF